MDLIRVKFKKSHPAYGYFEGEIGVIKSSDAPQMLKEDYILPIPGETDEAETKKQGEANNLPQDMPMRDKLFAAGYKTVADVKEAGESLVEIPGISVAAQKKIHKYLEKYVFPDA